MAPSPTAATAADGGGRVCAVITITATANANGESLPPSRTPSLTHSGATLRDAAFPVPPPPFSNSAHFPPKREDIHATLRLHYMLHLLFHRAKHATLPGVEMRRLLAGQRATPSLSLHHHPRPPRLSVHQISIFESSAHVERAHANHLKSMIFNSSVFFFTAIQAHASSLQVDPRAMAQSPIP